MKSFFLNHKNEIKYKDVEFESKVWTPDGMKTEKHIYTITGIGNKAIKVKMSSFSMITETSDT